MDRSRRYGGNGSRQKATQTDDSLNPGHGSGEPLPYDPATRILSLSFTRDPEEQADVMLEAGRRMTAGPPPLSAWAGFGLVIAFGAVVGIAMELYRRFVLPNILASSEIAPFSTVGVQLLPVIVLVLALYAGFRLSIAKRRRSALISRLEKSLVVDVDIYAQGLVAAGGPTTMEIDWPAVRNIFIGEKRVELECESFSIYIPERAFHGPAAFREGAREMRNLWREALRREHDRRLAAAGLE